MAPGLLRKRTGADVMSIRHRTIPIVLLALSAVSVACATREPALEETMRIERHIEQPMLIEAPLTPPLDPRRGVPREVLGVLGDIRFAPGSTVLLPSSRARLDGFARWLRNEYPGGDYFLEIQGHTDARGTDTRNDRLGEARAVTVSRYLSSRLEIPHARMSTVSAGASSPAAQDRTAAGRAMNRRVVILVLR
jgi:outer membrane protein OmpA-like peptidoglycan-associated protein